MLHNYYTYYNVCIIITIITIITIIILIIIIFVIIIIILIIINTITIIITISSSFAKELRLGQILNDFRILLPVKHDSFSALYYAIFLHALYMQANCTLPRT